MSKFSNIGFTNVFLTQKKSGPKDAILGHESQQNYFFEEVIIIFQKIGFEKKYDLGCTICKYNYIFTPG